MMTPDPAGPAFYRPQQKPAHVAYSRNQAILQHRSTFAKTGLRCIFEKSQPASRLLLIFLLVSFTITDRYREGVFLSITGFAAPLRKSPGEENFRC